MANLNDIVVFSTTYPLKSSYPPDQIKRFLSELISSEKLIFTVLDDGILQGAAVLLDKVSNPANDATFEILGLHPGCEKLTVLQSMIRSAVKTIPLERSGIQVTAHYTDSNLIEFLKSEGFSAYYDTYDLSVPDLNASDLRHDKAQQITEASQDDADQVYELLCDSFSANLDTSIPEKRLWLENYRKYNYLNFILWRESNQIIGFANLLYDKNSRSAEIRTLGVRASDRGRGIGRKLISHCLTCALDLCAKSVHLTVSTTNERALSLYKSIGFVVVDRYCCFRATRKT